MQDIISGSFGDRFLIFRAEQVAKTSNGWKNLRRITSSAYTKSSEDIRQIRNKNIKE